MTFGQWGLANMCRVVRPSAEWFATAERIRSDEAFKGAPKPDPQRNDNEDGRWEFIALRGER